MHQQPLTQLHHDPTLVFSIIFQLNFDHQVTSNTLTAVPTTSHQLKDISSINYYWGLCAVCCASLTSGFAGVFNEKLLKDGNQPSLFIRSLQLGIAIILCKRNGFFLFLFHSILNQGCFQFCLRRLLQWSKTAIAFSHSDFSTALIRWRGSLCSSRYNAFRLSHWLFK